LLCPFIVQLLHQNKFLPALLLFVLACTSDFLDGFLARKMNVSSSLGEVLDPLCDKLYCIVFFSMLVLWGLCPVWFLGLLVTVALLQCLGYILAKLPKISPTLSFTPIEISKWNTFIQFAWLGIIFADRYLKLRFMGYSGLSDAYFSVAYASIALLQVHVFFSYFSRFRILVEPIATSQ